MPELIKRLGRLNILKKAAFLSFIVVRIKI